MLGEESLTRYMKVNMTGLGLQDLLLCLLKVYLYINFDVMCTGTGAGASSIPYIVPNFMEECRSYLKHLL